MNSPLIFDSLRHRRGLVTLQHLVSDIEAAEAIRTGRTQITVGIKPVQQYRPRKEVSDFLDTLVRDISANCGLPLTALSNSSK